MLRVKKLRQDAILPNKAHLGDLGYDLFAIDGAYIHAGTTALISTGIAIQFPMGYGGLIRDRSSISTKNNVFVVAGVIDNGYIGEIKVALHNAGNGMFVVESGTKIAQLVLIPTVGFEVVQVDEVLSSDKRGVGGFGSTDAFPYDNYR